MTTDTPPCVAPRSPGPSARRPFTAAALLALLALGACAGGRQAQEAVAPAAPATPTDPIVAFAARSQPGAEARIVLADGQSATARLARSYNAASGRECREVIVGTGAAQSSQVVCLAASGGWVAARPLLRGGGVARP